MRAFSDLRYHKSMRDFFAIRMKSIFSTSTFQTPTFQTPILLVNLILFLSLFCSLFSLEMGSSWRNEPPYCHQEFGSVEESSSKMYSASCHCGRVRYNVRGEPESSKLCHCRGCQQLHGAPFEWVSDRRKIHASVQSCRFFNLLIYSFWLRFLYSISIM